MGARPRPERALRLVGVDRLERLGDLGLDDALPLERVEMDTEPLEGRLDLLEHPRHRVPRLPRELDDVLAAIAVLGRLLAAANRLDGLPEALHLRAGVVVVVLALDPVPGELEQACDRVAVRAVPCRRDGDRAGGVRGDELDLDLLGRVGRARSERAPGGEDRRRAGPEPRVVDGDVEEARAGHVDTLDALERSDPVGQLRRDLARRLSPLAREPERDVRRVVAVACVARALELDGSSRDGRERRGERANRVRVLHLGIVRPVTA